MKKILYLHGFASSPAGRKVAALREILEPEGFRIVAPDLNVPSFQKLDFAAISRVALWEAKRHAPAVIVGSSFGAVVALETERRGARAPLVLVAPAVAFGSRWVSKLPARDPIPFLHHGEGVELPIHRRFFEDLAKLEGELEPPRSPVVVVTGTNDESVPFEHVRDVWTRWEESGRLPAGSRFVEIAGGDHGLVDHAPAIAREISRLAALGPAEAGRTAT